MMERVLKYISIAVLVVAIGVFAFIVPNAHKDIKEATANQSQVAQTITKENKYQIITNPNASDIVFMTTMLAGTIVVSACAAVAYREFFVEEVPAV